MPDPSTKPLIDAVRRRLWRSRFATAVGRAAWLSASVLGLAMALHLAGIGLSLASLGALLALCWAACLGLAAWRRPRDRDCVDHADRQLGGASAFGTLLDLEQGGLATADPNAVHRVEVWAAARVPAALQALAERPASRAPSRALLSMAVCGALAATVLSLPLRLPVRLPGAATAQRGAPPAASVAGPESLPRAAAPTGIDAQVAGALQAAAEPEADGNREAAGAMQTRTADAGPAGEDAPRAPAADTGVLSSGASPTTPALRGGAASASLPTSADHGGGREAGDSPGATLGAGRETGSSSREDRRPAVAGGATVAGRPGLPPGGLRADAAQQATFESGEPLAGLRGSRAGSGLTAAAATPPPARASIQLSSTEAGYVRAWMQSSGESAR